MLTLPHALDLKVRRIIRLRLLIISVRLPIRLRLLITLIYGLPPLPPSSSGIVRLGSGRAIGEGIPVIAESELPGSYHELGL